MAQHDSTDAGTTETSPLGSTAGQQIGPYRLLRLLGEGGMGEVWEAEQEKPVRRTVALKLIKWGMDTKAVVARFEAERQALALMSHPNVAKVFDAGATEHGRPYFAMELVRGESISKYCDRQRLRTQERIQVFMQVCEGVQHAHQKGIIHRDIKPSNILVQIEGDKPVPKIIDFGVAKATEQRLTESTVFTELGQLIGTPEYMSPEQAEMTVQDIDTRTDVYSLGVLLYELLVGALPFDSRELRQAGFDEIRRRIREEEPSKPSTRISTLGGASSEFAKNRRTDPGSLARQLRGDLDWITIKSLEKDRTRRYSSPQELATDLGRHLTSLPVSAGPPSAVYRARKFVARHRVGVGVATSGVLVLLAFAVTMTVQAGRIARERDRANREAEVASQTSEFLENLFEVSDPDESRGATVTARELLDKSAEQIRTTPFDDAEVQARLMGTMGRVYRKLGQFEQAEPLLEQSLELRRSLVGDDHPDTLNSRNHLAGLYRDQGRYDEAEPLYLETLEASKQLHGEHHVSTLSTVNYLAMLYVDQGRYDDAEPLFLETLEARARMLGNDHPDTLDSMNNLAVLYLNQGRYDDAEPLWLDSLEARKRVLGAEHRQTIHSMNNLALVYHLQGHYDQAESFYLDSVETQRRVLGDDHAETLTSMGNLANLYDRQGRYDEAEQLYIETLEARRRVLGAEHPATLGSMGHLANLYSMQRRDDEAEPLYLETLEARRRVLGGDHPDTLAAIAGIAGLYEDLERYEEAESLYVESLEALKRVLGQDHPSTLTSMGNLGTLYTRLGRHSEAEPLLAEAVAGVGRALPREHVITGATIRKYAVCLTALGRYDDAEADLLEAHEILAAAAGAEHRQTQRAISSLVALYEAWDKPDEAAGWRAKLSDIE